MPGSTEQVRYEALYKIISFEGFDYRMFIRDEMTVLKPRLEEKGFTDIRFSMGEKDTFGPLTRICVCRDAEGKPRRFIYG